MPGRPAAFCPPVATFRDARSARGYWAATKHDVANGPALSADADTAPQATRAALVALLGPPTLEVASGGMWLDPETGELQDKLHMHWRLTAPTRTPEDHKRLERARRLAAELTGADRTNVPLSHPLRWAGAVHNKGEPRHARIVAETDREVDLDSALEALEKAWGERPVPEGDARGSQPEAAWDDVAAALAVIPNTERTDWHVWKEIAMATFRATAGGGFGLFEAWSAKRIDKHDPAACEVAWEQVERSPPDRIGFGSLVHRARLIEPEWVQPSRRVDATQWFEEPSLFADQAAETLPLISATPFIWRDPTTFPRRRWLYGHHLIRKFTSCTVAPGGLGKSSLVLVEAVAMATGRPLLGVHVPESPLTVWVLNLEDPQEEIERRVTAILLHYQIDPDELVGRLYIDSGRRVKLVVAEATRAGTVIAKPIVEAFTAEIRARKVDVVVIDPFVKSHRVPENDNGAIDLVATVFADIADACDCAFDLVHHVRKTGGAEVTVEDGRGAVALLGAVRSARALNGMTKEEAARVGEGANAREFFRADNGKLNMAPAPPDRAEWFRLVSVPLGNGDTVGCVVTWQWPDTMAGITPDHLREVQAAISEGRWRENHQARDWVGRAVASVLGLDLADKAQKAKVLSLVKAWTKSGALVVVDGHDERRKPVQFVEPGGAAA